MFLFKIKIDNDINLLQSFITVFFYYRRWTKEIVKPKVVKVRCDETLVYEIFFSEYIELKQI